jgi:hypothetical protein
LRRASGSVAAALRGLLRQRSDVMPLSCGTAAGRVRCDQTRPDTELRAQMSELLEHHWAETSGGPTLGA